MKFNWCTINVNDLEESLTFYRDLLKLPVNRRINSGEAVEIAFLGEGETQVELIDDKNSTTIEQGKNISIGFEVDSLEESMNFFKANNVEIYEGPIQPNPHIKFFYVLDPNGLKIQLIETM